MSEKFLTQHNDVPDSHRLEVYRSLGGYSSLGKALAMTALDLLAIPANLQEAKDAFVEQKSMLGTNG